MSDIEIQYELTEEVIWGEALATIVFRIEAVTSSVLESVAEFLIGNPKLRTHWPIEEHEGCPGRIEIELPDKSRLSESTFWHFIFDSVADEADVVIRYVAALTSSLEDGTELPPCSALEVVGQHPIYAYFDKHWEEFGHRPSENSRLLDMTDTFLNYLKHCDIDHEVPHRKYVEKVLGHLEWLDSTRFISFITFWIGADQRGTENVEFEHIREAGRLKILVDHLLETHVDRGWSLKTEILNLCAVAYGSNMALTEDVLSYCRNKVDIGDGHTLINFEKGLRAARERRDSSFAGWPEDLDTGFHRYDKKTGDWQTVAKEG